jgi:hypothetical protein
VGKRLRSSMVLMAGDTGPDGAPRDTDRSKGMSRFIELDREGGAVVLPPLPGDGPRLRVGACRIRRRPDSPSPCSPGCSGIIGDLCNRHVSEPWYHDYPTLSSEQEPLLRPISSCVCGSEKHTCTYFDMLANSMAVFASSEYRGLTCVLRLKAGLCACWAIDSRLPVE